MVSRYGKSLKSIKLNESKNYLFVFSPWFGYFSWITESLPRIYELEDELINYTLIIPESYSKKTFVIDNSVFLSSMTPSSPSPLKTFHFRVNNNIGYLSGKEIDDMSIHFVRVAQQVKFEKI